MTTARLFINGNSQAVRLPKEYRFSGSEVGIAKMGDVVILYPKDQGWKLLEESLAMFPDDFMADREQPKHTDKRGKL